jgi:hypothetical protein
MLDVLVNCDWMLRRLRRGEGHLWKCTFVDTPFPESRIIDFGDKIYERLQRRINAIIRNYRAALREIETLPVAAAEPKSNEQPAPEIGFVPKSHEYLTQSDVNQVGQALPPTLPAETLPTVTPCRGLSEPVYAPPGPAEPPPLI